LLAAVVLKFVPVNVTVAPAADDVGVNELIEGGASDTLTVRSQLLPLTVYEITAVPDATPETNPPVDTAATLALLVAHTPPLTDAAN